jgi:hypothetical protein
MPRSHLSQELPGFLTVVVLWLVLFATGFPPPFVDDLFFLGPAFNLVHTGICANPWCPGIGLIDPSGASEFFVYMPLHAHVLAGWISIFGVSTHSLTFFQCLAAALATLGLQRLVRPALSGVWASLALVACVAFYLVECGLRPEALALAFFGWGLMTLRLPSTAGWVLASLCLFASCITSPNIGVFAPLVAVVALGRSYYGESFPHFLRRLAWMVLAGTAIGVLFLSLIHFQLAQFLAVFAKARASSAPLLARQFAYAWTHFRFFKLLSLTLLPYVVLAGGLVVALWRPGFFVAPLSRWRVAWLGVGGLLTVIPMTSSATGGLLPSIYCLVVGLYLAATLKIHRIAGAAMFVAAFALFLHADDAYVALFAESLLLPRADSPAALRAQADAHAGRLYVDSYALRSVYDYRVPVNGVDYAFGSMAHFLPPHTPADFPPGDWIMATPASLLDVPRPSLAVPIHGLIHPHTVPNPYDCVLVPTGQPWSP